MTIANRDLNRRLENLEACFENAPVGTYQQAKDTVEAIWHLSNEILHTFRGYGFQAGNDDRLRNLEVAIYGYFLESNPDACFVHSAEGFGRHMDNPLLRDRIITDAAANR